MLTYLTTNIFHSPAQTLVNTVNTVGVMGKGIALTFKKLYPDMYKQYRQLCKAGQFDIGQLYVYRTPNKIIVNFPTKKHWRNPSKVDYIEAGLKTFVESYGKYGISSVSFPQLGCGNGELNWDEQVKPVMERYLKDLPIPVYIHLYAQYPDFLPERLDSAYAQQVQLERQIIPFAQVWQDLQALVWGPGSNQAIIEIDQERIVFHCRPEQPLIVYRQDVEDLWNTLRLSGTVSNDRVPEPIRADGAIDCLFELLAHLPYIQMVDLQPLRHPSPSRGLQYMPPPQTEPQEDLEIVM